MSLLQVIHDRVCEGDIRIKCLNTGSVFAPVSRSALCTVLVG